MLFETLKKYTEISAPSGSEENLRNAILSEIKPFATNFSVDNLGNLIVFKKGKRTPAKKIMLDAHTDEVGFIITGARDDGSLRFSTLGGIDTKVLFGKRVKIGDTIGVIGGCAVHLLDAAARKKTLSTDELSIDIGASSKEEALNIVPMGSSGTFYTEFIETDTKIAARGLDDKIGCAIMTELIKSPLEFDMYFSFSVQEEIGCRGAVASAYTIAPDCAITIESTTAADIFGVPDDKTVCKVGGGAALSYMDNGTLYDAKTVSNILKIAEENGISAQAKTAVAGGTNASSIHKSRGGVKTVNIALPCRYIHSAYCVASKSDAENMMKLVKITAEKLCTGEL